MNYLRYLSKWIFPALAALLFAAGCSDDPTEGPRERNGYVQFRVLKNMPSSEVRTMSRADGGDRLDSLSYARKMRITLSSNEAFIEQALVLSAASDSLGEYGLRSEKLQLLAGDYELLGYELYDNLDKRIFSGEPAGRIVVRVVPGGLTIQEVAVNTLPRGLAKFVLANEFSQFTRADIREDYMLGNVAKADVKVHNEDTGETVKIEGMRTKIDYYYDESKKTEENRDPYLSSRSLCDTLVPLTAGRYRITSYTVYNNNDRILEVNADVAENEFVVENNGIAEATVPVTLQKTAGHVLDGIVLKEIWEALDGPNWSYRGMLYPEGSNWDFNRDIDLWTAQPGVEVLPNGRVASVSFGGFGAKGDIPECLGELTELRHLYLGTHLEYSFQSPIYSVEELYKQGGVDAVRKNFEQLSEPLYALARFPEEMRMTFSEEQRARIAVSESFHRQNPMGSPSPENYSNAITSLPRTIGRLQNLEMLYIANGLISELPDSIALLKKCTDLEIYNCRKMTKFPMAVANMPKVISLNLSFNPNLPHDELYKGLQAVAAGEAGKTVQGLFLNNDNLEQVPDLRAMKKLRTLSCLNNRVKGFDAPFGKDFVLGKLLMSNNKISSLPRDEEGYFIGFDGNVEGISFAQNEFTELPDIFDASDIYELGTVDFSFNKIKTIENADNGTYKGILAEIVMLSYNQLPEFPKCIYNAGSHIIYLSLAGNGMTGFEKGALEGDRVIGTTTLDLSSNKLKKLPDEFNNDTFPYMTALDMSYNRFDAYPWRAMNLANLTMFIFRHQRDENGYRCMKEWPKGISAHHGLRALLLGSNDIRKVDDKLPITVDYIYTLDISDNPNIVIDVTNICPFLQAGLYGLMYDPTQDIRGCDALNLTK